MNDKNFLDSSSQDKYLCIFPDYCASGFWARNNVSLEMEDIPISEELKEEVEVMNRMYSQEEVDSKYERHDYVNWSYRLALKIKAELPDWEIAFMNADDELGLGLPVNNYRSII